MRFHTRALLASAVFSAVIIAAIPWSWAWAQPQPASPAVSDATNAGATGGATPSPAGTSSTTSSSPARTPAVNAAAEPLAAGTAAVPPPRRMVASVSHDLQFGLSVLLGGGYRGIFPYYDTIKCGDAKDENNRVCTSRSPTFIDIQPSFGLSHTWDFLVDVRFGLEKDFNTHHQLFIMPGFRYWLDPQSTVKFFTTLQLAYDRSKQNNPVGAPHPVSDNDLGFRNSNGLMVEIMRNFGVYFQFGETIGVFRWLSFAVDAGIGVQARVP
jgi:hypothetical protein